MLLHTSRYVPDESLWVCLSRHLVYFGLKLADPEMYKCCAGGDNAIILNDLHRVAKSGMLFMIRGG